MNVFQYPKDRHKRKLKPMTFVKYKSYKPYLQHEFYRICVYCRQPDSAGPNVVFGVDHYRPKSIPKFAHLECDYDNLFYCCFNCNTRKRAYWPLDEISGKYIVNPVDHEMAKHLRLDSRTGIIEARTPHGDQTEQLLQLNNPELVTYRKNTLLLIPILQNEVKQLQLGLAKLKGYFASGKMDLAEYEERSEKMSDDKDALETHLQGLSGTKALPKLPRQRNGYKLYV